MQKRFSVPQGLCLIILEDLCAFFVQAFWLCHSPVTILLHLPASIALFPHTPQWKSPLASSFRVNTERKCYETPPWKTRPPNFLQKANGTQSAAILHAPTLDMWARAEAHCQSAETQKGKKKNSSNIATLRTSGQFGPMSTGISMNSFYFFSNPLGEVVGDNEQTSRDAKKFWKCFHFFVLICFKNCGLQMHFL